MEFKALFGNYSQHGIVSFISVRPKRLEPVTELQEVMAVENRGLAGDRYKSTGGARQVTLIQAEHLSAIASYLGLQALNPMLTRRNIVVSGLSLLSLKGKKFQIGEAILEHSGDCHPCSRMEEILGVGGYNAMRGLGGITAKIIQSGRIKTGDPVIPL